jgi:disulfide bond formation protein DsbB
MNTKQSPLAALNALGVLGISLILLVAFYYQFAHGELPCPLCLLQRAGFVIIGMGFLFNLRVGERASHYAMVLAGALVTGFTAMRQVALHLAPGDAGYGSTFLGLHFYTWALIAAVGVVGYLALMFIAQDVLAQRAVDIGRAWSNALFVLFALLIAANLVSTVLECGAGQCEDNPLHYLLLE